MSPAQGKTKTRGPRTPHERSRDAARTAATLFEKLPPSSHADEYLKPIALFLRFWVSTDYLEPGLRLRDVREWAKAERELHDLLRRFEEGAEHMPLRSALEVERLIAGVKRKLRKVKEQIALAAGGEDD